MYVYRDKESNSNTLRPKDGISCHYNIVHSNCTKHNEITIHLCYSQKLGTKNTWFEHNS